MPNDKTSSRIENGKLLILERVFDAPRELVFAMFKEPEHLKHWWGPRGWELTACTIDFRPGGIWHYCMTCVDPSRGALYGTEAWGKAVYTNIDEPETIAYTDFFSDAEGNVDGALPVAEVTNSFFDLGSRTRLVSRWSYDSADALKDVMDRGTLQGVTEMWDRLAEQLGARELFES